MSVSCCFGKPNACSFKKCRLFLCIFLAFTVIIIVVAALIVIFILKPQNPVFTLQSIKLNSYMLKAYSDSSLFVSSAITLILRAKNPNIFSLKYRPSRLHLYFHELRIGLLRVPGFYQGAHSDNVSVAAEILVDYINVTEVVYEGLLRENFIQMKLLGDVGVQVRLFRLVLPQIKVAVDCDISFEYVKLIFNDEAFNLKTAMHSTEYFDANDKSFSMKCSPALNM